MRLGKWVFIAQTFKLAFGEQLHCTDERNVLGYLTQEGEG